MFQFDGGVEEGRWDGSDPGAFALEEGVERGLEHHRVEEGEEGRQFGLPEFVADDLLGFIEFLGSQFERKMHRRIG